MPKPFISQSTQDANQYAGGGTGIGDSEEYWMSGLAWRITELLASWGMTPRLGSTVSVGDNVARSNAWGADSHWEIHSNAGGGHGTEVWYYKSPTGVESTKGKKMAQAVYPLIAAASNQPDRGIKASSSYYALRATKAPAVIIEVAFHDNVTEAEEIRTSLDEYALAIAKGIAAYYGVSVPAPAPTPVPQPTPAPETPDPQRVWRITEQSADRIVMVKSF